MLFPQGLGRVLKRVVNRRNLPRFGDAKIGEENVTIQSRDYIAMEHPDDQLLEDVDDPTMKNSLASFILKQQERTFARENDDGDAKQESEVPLETEPAKTDRYVPPAERLRQAGGSAPTASSKDGEQSDNTLRVSNLTKAVTEDDLYELFGRFGRVSRVSLPRVEVTVNGAIVKEPRGFAYIAYHHHDDAARALEKLQGYGYDHLIIKLEWAKPTNKDGNGPPSGGGLAGGFSSGYGQKLAQDTKEKVSYHGHR